MTWLSSALISAFRSYLISSSFSRMGIMQHQLVVRPQPWAISVANALYVFDYHIVTWPLYVAAVKFLYRRSEAPAILGGLPKTPCRQIRKRSEPRTQSASLSLPYCASDALDQSVIKRIESVNPSVHKCSRSNSTVAYGNRITIDKERMGIQVQVADHLFAPILWIKNHMEEDCSISCRVASTC